MQQNNKSAVLNEDSDNVLHIAITMAGAVSAGSYTSGVLDYLLEALDSWEKAKKENDPRIPRHQVRIELLNGTSAGGMTAIIAATALHDTIIPVSPANNKQGGPTGNKLYDSWVKLTGDDNLLPKMLETDDIKDDIVPSLLNSTFIEDISNKIVAQVQEDVKVIDRPYIAKDLEVMVTLTNLSGIPYKTVFGTDNRDAFIATNHLDYGHFVFTDRLDAGIDRIPISLRRNDDCNLLRQSAMATGAFPLGLAPRPVSRLLRYIESNRYINLDYPKFVRDGFADPYETINVDGGVLNNEPFDKAEEIFQRTYGQGMTPDELKSLGKSDSFRYTILMIDPFPSTDSSEEKLDLSTIYNIVDIARSFTKDSDTLAAITNKLKEFEVTNGRLDSSHRQQLEAILGAVVNNQETLANFQMRLSALNQATTKKPNLQNVASSLFRAARNQLLFKKEDIGQATDKQNYSRFMIVPKRYSTSKETKISGSKAIACGSFGGFGGFIAEDFRKHDFFLGRMNCKSFLIRHFGVPITSLERNPIFEGAYSPEAIAAFSYEDLDSNKKPIRMVPIIPLVDFKLRGAQNEVELTWPTIDEQKICDLRNQLKKRSRAILNILFKPRKRLWKPLVAAGVWIFDGKVADTIIETIIDNFREHRLLKPTGDISKDISVIDN